MDRAAGKTAAHTHIIQASAVPNATCMIIESIILLQGPRPAQTVQTWILVQAMV